MTALSYWHWFALGILIMIAESLGTAGFLIAIGSAAISLGVICLALKLNLFWQLLVFSLLCVAYALIWWRFFQKQQQETASTLNRPLESLIGQTSTLAEAISNGRGKIYLNDAYWTVYGEDLPQGQRVRVVGMEGDKLMVQAVE